MTSQRPPPTFSHQKRDEGGLFTTRAASGHAVSPRSRQRAARAAHTAPYSRQHVQGCVRGPEGRAGDPLPPVPDVQGERGGAQFLAQELQEDESREPRDAHLDQRGERRAGWHGGPLRYVADIRLDIETHASNSRGPSAVALFAASTRHTPSTALPARSSRTSKLSSPTTRALKTFPTPRIHRFRSGEEVFAGRSGRKGG